MPQGKFKSRSLRRVQRRTPSGVSKRAYTPRKPSKAVCGNCGTALKGVARGIPSKIKNMRKTARRPTRPFAGVLCSACTRKIMVAKARSAATA